ncbi:MAG: acyl-CoA thioesterase [Clostridiaceae bacterium]|jgi:acyl-CoA thioester hydrolase|nr:acyl-CoA thioesterase [Clostridiaceae bacterium]
MFVSETKFVVRYAETDQMGVVHHSNYAVWFEAGRTDFIRKMGMPYSMIEEKGAMLPLLELRCRFKGFARYEDVVVVRTRIKEYTGTRLVFHYEVARAGEERLLTEGETMHCWTNRELKPVNIKKFMPELYDLIERSVQDI